MNTLIEIYSVDGRVEVKKRSVCYPVLPENRKIQQRGDEEWGIDYFLHTSPERFYEDYFRFAEWFEKLKIGGEYNGWWQ